MKKQEVVQYVVEKWTIARLFAIIELAKSKEKVVMSKNKAKKTRNSHSKKANDTRQIMLETAMKDIGFTRTQAEKALKELEEYDLVRFTEDGNFLIKDLERSQR